MNFNTKISPLRSINRASVEMTQTVLFLYTAHVLTSRLLRLQSSRAQSRDPYMWCKVKKQYFSVFFTPIKYLAPYIHTMSYYVYIMGNHTNTTLYIGMTNSLYRRVEEHKGWRHKGFTQRYACKKLLYYEIFETAYEAITREKQCKKRSRSKKEQLIQTVNPQKFDLSRKRN